ncbi:MAG: Hsp20/alpha crystallin family protein [Deltaproteobacteria bacterium]|nr:Hsp20/alpha crystallin family protein [Deltaproteobacteria bacterium]
MDPLREMQRLQGEMSRIFSGLGQPLNPEVPPVNAWVGESDVVVTAELPGVDPERVDVSVVGDTLTISGSREAEPLKEGENYHRQERSHGRFTRSLQLPFHVEAGKVDAKYEKGVLRITLPRAEADKPRKISVMSE